MEATNVHFKVEGEFITDHIRKVACDPNITLAWNTFLSLCPPTKDVEMEKNLLSIFKEILKGKKENALKKS